MLETAAALAVNINWEWTMGLDRFTTRYGRLGDHYYRQFMPFGIINDTEYPPKRISEKVYQMADRILKREEQFVKTGWW
jgi:hypothetical protein